MTTYATPHVPRAPRAPRVTTERAILAILVVAAVFAAVSGARITWPTTPEPTPGPTTASAPTIDHAARVAVAAVEARDLREAARTVPAIAPVLADRIQLLDLVTSGVLPVAAAEPIPPVPATSVAWQQVDPAGISATIQARQELRSLKELLRVSPSLGPALAEDAATLEAIARGDVPSRTVAP